MTTRVLTGDCREVLRTLPAESVHCVVTSPPYFGLRSYGVGIENGEIGLEPTPELYVTEMVAVFREVHRVLRKDGTVWLNLGMSYASRGIYPSRSREPLRAPACDIGGIEPSDYQETDSAYSDPDDERPSGSLSHRGRNLGIDPHAQRSSQHPLNAAGRGSEHPDCDAQQMPVLAFPASTILASPDYVQVSLDPGAKASASRPLLWTSSPGSQASAHNSVCNGDTAELSDALVGRRMGRAASGSACGTPGCDGCGICWAYLAIPLLNLKSKDEINTPHFVALALQADGWYLRQTICWSKPNPMPESVRDRCTKAHEYIFLLSKSASYYYDADAVAEAATRPEGSGNLAPYVVPGQRDGENANLGNGLHRIGPRETRNRRSVWTVATQPYSEAHFATFPPALIEPCIKAGTSENGCCLECGAPWTRTVERTGGIDKSRNLTPKHSLRDKLGVVHNGQEKSGLSRPGWRDDPPAQTKTLDWSPSCSCDVGVTPCTVLDPFGGAGTTGLVADRLQRNAILIELNPEYAAMAEKRIRGDCPMFSNLAAAE